MYLTFSIFPVKHVKEVDGLVGCYRGLGPKLIGSVVGIIGSEKVIKKLGLDEAHEDDEKDEFELTDEQRFDFKQLLVEHMC